MGINNDEQNLKAQKIRCILLSVALAVFVIVIVPYLINWLVHLSSPKWLSISGTTETESVWIGFWASYIGSILAACVAFIVLYKTLKQNERENILNRNDAHSENLSNSQRQLELLSYEVSRQHLSDIRNTLVDCFMALEQEKTNDLLWHLKQENTYQIDLSTERDSISKVVDDENRAYYKLELLIPQSSRDDEVDRIMRDIRAYSIESHMCLSDLVWLAQLYSNPSLDLSNQAEISDSVSELYNRNRSRLNKEGYNTIDRIIVDNKWYDFQYNKDAILKEWQRGRSEVNRYLLNSLIEMNEHQTQKAESIIK